MPENGVTQGCLNCPGHLPPYDRFGLGSRYRCPCGQWYELRKDRFFFPTPDNAVLWVAVKEDHATT
jgi:hypothetical protein